MLDRVGAYFAARPYMVVGFVIGLFYVVRP